ASLREDRDRFVRERAPDRHGARGRGKLRQAVRAAGVQLARRGDGAPGGREAAARTEAEMKLEAVDQLAVFYEPSPERRRKVGRLARKGRQILFEYEPEFLGSKLELSPFHLRLRPGVVVGPPELDGLMGVFDDSLPDGWGR